MPVINRKSIKMIPEHKAWEGVDQSNYSLYNSTTWRMTAKAYIKSNPLCKHCKDKGILTQACIVDHIIPINQGGDVWDWDNLQGLCRSCNASKTSKQKNIIR